MSDAADPRLEIVPNRHRVRVIHQGITYADSLGALTVREAGLPDVHYLPRTDVNMQRLVRSSLTTVCDRVAALADGKIVAIGPMRELLQCEHPWVRAYFHGKRSQMLQHEMR